MVMMYGEEVGTTIQEALLSVAKPTDALHKAGEVLLYSDYIKEFEWANFWEAYSETKKF